MEDSLYVIEAIESPGGGPPINEQAYTYDTDYTDALDIERGIICTNKRPLIVEGLMGTIKRILSCQRTKTLFILEEPADGSLNASVHCITPEGAALHHWTLDEPAEQVNHWSFFPLGDCLMVTYDRCVVLYHSKTGTIERSLNVFNISDGNRGPFLKVFL